MKTLSKFEKQCLYDEALGIVFRVRGLPRYIPLADTPRDFVRAVRQGAVSVYKSRAEVKTRLLNT